MPRQDAPALDRGLRLLALLAEHPEGLAWSTITALTELPAATLARLLRVLAAHDFVRHEDDGRWYLASSPVAGPQRRLEAIGAPQVLGDLAADTRCTAILIARDGAGLRTIARHRHPEGPEMRPTGSIRYTFATHSWGLALLVNLPAAETLRLLRREGAGDTARAAVQGARRDLRAQGWCSDRTVTGWRLAAPILDAQHRPLGALALGGHAAVLTASARVRCGRLLALVAADCSQRLAAFTSESSHQH